MFKAVIATTLIYLTIYLIKNSYDLKKILKLARFVLFYNTVKISERSPEEILIIADFLYKMSEIPFAPFSWNSSFYIKEEDIEKVKDFLLFVRKNKRKLKEFINE